MKYDLTQTFDCSVEALEKALLDPGLVSALATSVRGFKEIEETARTDEGGRVTRKLRVVANVEVPSFARGKITPDMMMWTEEQTYDRARKELSFRIIPNKESARGRFDAHGTQRLVAEGTRSRREIRGEIHIKLTLIGGIAERFVAGEFQKNWADEAEVLRRQAAQG